MDSCPLEVTQQQLDNIQKCEAVVIREWERPDGSRFSKVMAWGDADEMQDQADTPALLVAPNGFSIICQKLLMVSDLLGA